MIFFLDIRLHLTDETSATPQREDEPTIVTEADGKSRVVVTRVNLVVECF